MHALALLLTREHVTVRTSPTAPRPALCVCFWAYFLSQAVAVLLFPSIAATPNGSPSGSSALRRWAAFV